ncbi:MAG TPA: DUF4421 family protein [Bacteroidia bacterium]|nr:DUF4421 family protein [Bacteroidia bacterium]
METKRYRKILFLIPFILALTFANSYAQDTTAVKRSSRVKTIWDIPHKTLREKWMWIHRSVAFNITKDRPINYDTAYIRSYKKRLVVTIPVAARFLKFTLIDIESKNKLAFTPNLQYNLGISLSSRWASFIVNSRIKVYGGENGVKGKTNYRDYQLNLYGRKFTTDMFVQYYQGFYIRNSKDYSQYVSEKPYQIRDDVYAINIGVSSYYIVNHKRFSYRNSFAFTEQQKKSAGSLLLGIYYSYFTATGSPSLVSDPFRSSFDTLSLIKSGSTHNFGFNLGYIYTLVFLKKCYVTASLVQGIGGKYVSYRRDDNTTFNQLIGGAGKLNVRAGLGYDQGRYFIGAMGMFDYFLLGRKTSSTLDYTTGKFMLYIGYRFSVLKAETKMLKKLKLIDY